MSKGLFHFSMYITWRSPYGGSGSRFRRPFHHGPTRGPHHFKLVLCSCTKLWRFRASTAQAVSWHSSATYFGSSTTDAEMDFSRSLAGHGSRYTWDTVPMSGAPRLNGLLGNSRHAQGKRRGYGFLVRRERLSELRPSTGDPCFSARPDLRCRAKGAARSSSSQVTFEGRWCGSVAPGFWLVWSLRWALVGPLRQRSNEKTN